MGWNADIVVVYSGRDGYRYKRGGYLALKNRELPVCITVVASSSPTEWRMWYLLAFGIEHGHVYDTGYTTHTDVVLGIGVPFFVFCTCGEEARKSVTCVG